MNTVVVYASEYGSTKTYAETLAKKLVCPCYEYKNFNSAVDYDNIIFGGPIYSENVIGLKEIFKYNYDFSDKNLIIFSCGLLSPCNEENQYKLKENILKSVPNRYYKNLKMFFLPGKIDYSKLSFTHRITMRFIYSMLLNKKKELNKSEKSIIYSFGEFLDLTDNTRLDEIIDYVKNLSDK
ncbi:hypothetical protein ING2D1G_0065 [Peptoniphilus sp. ING2-D1G]|nr:hypothetical protein ING2D1G_0065 [Peptoniphilus sp. ING2-D1G]